MKKKVSLILWLVCIATYIFNIVIVYMKGATLVNNIIGWYCSIIMAITIILLQCRIEQLSEARKNDLRWVAQMLEFISKTKKELEDQTEQKTENKEVNNGK